MAKLTLTALATLRQESALTQLNANQDATETALENTLSRDGTAPNAMGATLDMNSNRIINLPEPTFPTEPMRFGDAIDLLFGEIVYEPEDGVIQFATKAIAEQYDPDVAPAYLRLAGYAAAGDGGGALYKKVGAEPSHEGKFDILEGSWYELAEYPVSTAMFGAHPTATAATNVAAINNAINMVNAKGGGRLRIPYLDNAGTCIYSVEATTQTDVAVKFTNPDSTLNLECCIVIRDKVAVEIDPGVIIEGPQTESVVGFYDCENGAALYCPTRGNRAWIRSTWDPGEVPASTGHCIHTFASTKDTDQKNIAVMNLRISNVKGYGMGMNVGANYNNIYSGLWIHDTGVAGIDHKCRGGATFTDELTRSGGFFYQIGNLCVDNIFERTGQFDSDACVDWRGPGIISRNYCKDFAKTGLQNAGIRVSAGQFIEDGAIDEFREPSSFSVVADNLIDAGDPSITNTRGIHVLSSPNTRIVNNTIRNCGGDGINQGNSASNTNRGRAFYSGNVIEGSWLTGVTVSGNSESCVFVGLIIQGAIDRFDENRGNLIVGQTVLNTDRPFDTATVIVYKNDALLPAADYTVTDTDTITLDVAAIAGDEFQIITPTAVGVDNDGLYSTFTDWRFEHVTTPFEHDSGGTPSAEDTVMEYAAAMPSRAGMRLDSEDTTDKAAVMKAYGDATNIDLHFESKGTGWMAHEVDGATADGGSFAFHKWVTQITADSNQSITTTMLRGGIIERTDAMTVGRTDTTVSAANIVEEPGTPKAGFSYEVILCNLDAALTWTIAGGTGVTIKGTATIPASSVRRALVHFTDTDPGTEAVTIYIP